MIPEFGTYALEGEGLVKIGKSNDIPKRIRAIQRYSPVPLRLIGTLPSDIETELHRELIEHHAYGEWFELEPALDVLRARLEPQDVDVLDLLFKRNGGLAPYRMRTHCARGHELTPETCIPNEISRASESGRSVRRCAICTRERDRSRTRDDKPAWIEANREQINAGTRERYKARREEVTAASRRRYADRRAAMTEEELEQEREKARARYAANREKIKARAARWRDANREAKNKYAREWRAARRGAGSSTDKKAA